MGLHGLFRQEEPFTDLAVDEAVGDQLKDLDLASRWILSDLACSRGLERDDGATPRRATAGRSRLEASAVVAVTIEDLLALSGVHESGIGLACIPL
jgi:hypothetical protein